MEIYLLLLTLLISLHDVYCQPDEGIIDVRLAIVDGFGPKNEGGVEVEFKARAEDQSDVWLPVCWQPNHQEDERWGKEESRVVCRQLGYTGGWPFLYTIQYRVYDEAIDDVICEGDEEHLADCRYDGEAHLMNSQCGINNQAGVKCFDIADVRLIDDQPTSKPNQGNVEVKYNIANTDWMEVCYIGSSEYDQPWDLVNARVVCLQLGYPGVMSTKIGTRYRNPFDNIYSVDNITCDGDETNIAECFNDLPSASKCEDSNKAEVICFLPGYEGCFESENEQKKILPNFEKRDTSMTVIKCHDHCRQQGLQYVFAGLTGGTRCRCGTWEEYVPYRQMNINDEDCSAPCGGDESITCGGTNRIAIYKVDKNVCLDPEMVSNAKRTGESLAFSSIITYSCDEGYELIGEPAIQCIMGRNATDPVRWNTTVPVCKALPSTEPPTTTSAPGIIEGSVQHPLDIGLLVGMLAAALLLIILIITTICFLVSRKKAARQDNIAAGDISSEMVYPSPVFDPNGDVIDNVYFNPAVLPVDPDYDELSLPVKGVSPDELHPSAVPNVYGDNSAASAMAPAPLYDSNFPEKPKWEP